MLCGHVSCWSCGGVGVKWHPPPLLRLEHRIRQKEMKFLACLLTHHKELEDEVEMSGHIGLRNTSHKVALPPTVVSGGNTCLTPVPGQAASCRDAGDPNSCYCGQTHLFQEEVWNQASTISSISQNHPSGKSSLLMRKVESKPSGQEQQTEKWRYSYNFWWGLN